LAGTASWKAAGRKRISHAALDFAPPTRIKIHLKDDVLGEFTAADLAEEHLPHVVWERWVLSRQFSYNASQRATG
jgi:hypothetical protein